MLYNKIFNTQRRNLAVLIDPEKQTIKELSAIVDLSQKSGADFFLVGGSLISVSIEKYISKIKENSSIPVILFPGSLLQLSDKADAILLLSLISGRNPDLLIGNHINAAPFLKKSGLEIIPTGYMLIDGGKKTSVEYMSNTSPIPADKPEIAVATAIAGEMTGKKLIYLEAGSGALNPVPAKMICSIKDNINIPLIVGGGIRTSQTLRNICKAGANTIVIGNAFENDYSLIQEFSEIIHE